MRVFRIKKTKLDSDQNAFMMPVVLTFMVIITSLGLTLLQASLQAQSATIRYSYTQMAHIASKAAIDYAEEAFELDPNYNGTPEQDLVLTGKYRLTIQVDVLYNQGANAKRVQAFGRVYIPETDGNASFVRDIQASVIRTGNYIICDTCGVTPGGDPVVDPATFDPLVWLDANEPNSLIQPVVGGTGSQYIESRHGSSFRDVAEERGSNANRNPGRMAFGSSDLEMAYDGYNKGHQTIGLRFRGLNTPQSATVGQAYIQFTADETKRSGSLDLLVEGIDEDNASNWQTSNYSISSRPTTSAFTDWTPADWNVVGASGANERVDVTDIVQEIVDRTGWSPGNAIAFTVSYVQGSGIRTAESGKSSGDPELFVEWDTGVSGGGFADTNGQAIGTWTDKSINNNDAELEFGSAPTVVTGAVNGLSAVRFDEGVLESSLDSLVSGTAITAFTVMRPQTSSANEARFLSAMRSTQNQDFNTYDGVVLLQKDSSTTQIRNYYRNQVGETLPGAIDNSWAIYTSRISSVWVERLLKNGSENYSGSISNINYDIDQIYVGGTRDGSVGTQYADADIAEVIVFDYALECTELNEVEVYLADRYAIPVTEKTC